LPYWQVFEGFKPMRRAEGVLVTFCPRRPAPYADTALPEETVPPETNRAQHSQSTLGAQGTRGALNCERGGGMLILALYRIFSGEEWSYNYKKVWWERTLLLSDNLGSTTLPR